MKETKINNILYKIISTVLIIISIILLLIGISSIFINGYFESTFYHPAEKTYFSYSIGIKEIIISTITIALICFLNKKILKKIPDFLILILLLIGSLGLYIYWIKALQIMPSNDQKVIYEMVQAFLSGNISSYTGIDQYLFLYPYQIGITLIISMFFKIFGINYLTFEYINAICSILNILLLYIISKKIFNDKNSNNILENNNNHNKILLILLAGFSLYFMFFNVHFYGNIIGLTFALISILLIIMNYDKNKFYIAIFSALFIKLAIIAKSNYDIFLIGIIIFIILQVILKPSKNNLLSIIAFILTFVITSIFYNLFTNQILKIDLSNSGVPMISFVYMGIAEPTDKSPGWYTGDPISIYRQSNYDSKLATQKTNELITCRMNYFMNNPKDFTLYFLEKIASTWLNPTFQTVWCSLPGQRYNYDEEYAHYLSYHETSLSMVDGKLYNYEEEFFNIYQIIIFVFAGISLIYLYKGKNLNIILLPTIFLGGFLFHILWETKSIYVLQYYYLLLPFSAYGINKISHLTTSKINNTFNNIKSKKKTNN